VGNAHDSCHVALGLSYSDTYCRNSAELTEKLNKKLGFNGFALRDMVNTDQKRVSAHLTTGEKTTIYENGQFTC
jgi:aminopeptidase